MKRSAELLAADFARRHVREHLSPPRPVSWRELAAGLHRLSSERWMVGLGLFVLGFVGYGLLTREDPSPRFVFLGVVSLAVGLACVAAPSFFAYRVCRAIRLGLVVAATTVSATGTNGEVEGTLSVPHPTGPFRFDFLETADVAAGIEAGSRVDVLVHPRRRRLLYLVGATPSGVGAPDAPTS